MKKYLVSFLKFFNLQIIDKKSRVLSDFHNSVYNAVNDPGKALVSVRVEYKTFGDINAKLIMKPTVDFSCYAHGYNWVTAPTPEEAIDKLMHSNLPKETVVTDVVI